MYYFEQTATALEELDSQRRFVLGEHQSFEARPGYLGQIVGDVPYDPERHNPEDINPLSIWEEVLEQPHVTYALPPRPLDVDLVMHIDDNTSDHRGISRAKQILGSKLIDAIQDATGWSDRVNVYIVGTPDKDIIDSGAQVIETGPDVLTTAQTVAELCTSGLAIVISDFYNLPLADTAGMEAEAAVGIQVIHSTFEHALPTSRGLFTLGQGREADTQTKKQSRLFKHRKATPSFNEKLSHYQQNVLQQAGLAGLAVTQVLFNPDLYEPHVADRPGFDEPATDAAIASAINEADSNKHKNIAKTSNYVKNIDNI